ncbi:hypothetical protein M5F04_05555 [Acinetobacter sp. ANC 7200]|uniref:virulence factor TspB C-terminal domain-related protein n=1 Tax=Acinetobacter amyesii TaxID=2942470 RepID=UPI0020C02B29|nr:virulence factor TspB C-terminal domain-related protein [Acinetobacter amyesii]MCL6244042.1 hypothetical protein [Acinetobacter amyesii]
MGCYKKHLIKILVCFCLVYTPFFANASSNVGGWSMGNPVAQGASAVYTGTKNVIINGADYIKKGTAKITPTASQVAKVLRGGAAGYALSIAVEQMLGAVDWVLDPANNQIVYYPPASDPNSPTVQFIYTVSGHSQTAASTPSESCRLEKVEMQKNSDRYNWQTTYTASKVAIPSSGSWYFDCILTSVYNPTGVVTVSSPLQGTRKANPAYNPTAEQEKKTLPLDLVAQQVVSNANSGDTNAQVATMAAAADIVDEASKDDAKARPIAQQLESTAKTTPADEAAADSAGTATGESTANPETGATDLKLEFPIFCNWAPSVCEAAQVVISFPQTLTNWWNTATTSITEAWAAVKEWATAEPETTDTELDIPEEDQEATDTNISFDNSCPAPISVPVSWNGNTIHFDFSFDMFCQSFGTYVKPIIIALGAFHAVLIVSGVRINE